MAKRKLTVEERRLLEQRWLEADLSDDFLFGKVVQDEGIYPELIEAITKDFLGKKGNVIVQRSAKNSRFGKGARFDLVVETIDKIYDLEMQNVTHGNIPKRMRVYGSIIDSEILNEGEEYDQLKASAIIFVVKTDPFKKGLVVYTFENICIEDKNLKLNDGCVKIILNAAAYNKIEDGVLKTFLKCVMGEFDKSMFSKKLSNKIDDVKKNEKIRSEFMSVRVREMDYIKEGRMLGISEGKALGISEGKAIGISEGKEDAKQEHAIALLDVLDDETIASKIGIDIEKVRELRLKNKK